MNFFFWKKKEGGGVRSASHHQVKSLGDGIWRVGKDRWEISSRYDVEEPIGSGAYGSVVRAKDKVTKRLVAIKRIEGAALSNSTDALRILREVSILSRIKHRNVVSLLWVQPPPDIMHHLYVVFEFAGTDLQKLFHSDSFITIELVESILHQLLLGISFLHRSGIVHRDLKPANVLLDPDTYAVKIGDFGLAKLLDEKDPEQEGERVANVLNGAVSFDSRSGEGKTERQGSKQAGEGRRADESSGAGGRKGARFGGGDMTGHIATRWYRAPEVILGQVNYGAPIDVWACGCIFAEVLQLQKEVQPDWRLRKPLFPGGSCFPLSPTSAMCFRNDNDQLNVIFSVIGTPSQETISRLDVGNDAKTYLCTLRQVKKKSLSSILPGASDLSIDLLDGMLALVPGERLTLDEGLRHPFLRNAKNASMTSPPREVRRSPVKDRQDAGRSRVPSLRPHVFGRPPSPPPPSLDTRSSNGNGLGGSRIDQHAGSISNGAAATSSNGSGWKENGDSHMESPAHDAANRRADQQLHHHHHHHHRHHHHQADDDAHQAAIAANQLISQLEKSLMLAAERGGAHSLAENSARSKPSPSPWEEASQSLGSNGGLSNGVHHRRRRAVRGNDTFDEEEEEYEDEDEDEDEDGEVIRLLRDQNSSSLDSSQMYGSTGNFSSSSGLSLASLVSSNANLCSLRVRYLAKEMPDGTAALKNLLRNEVARLRPPGSSYDHAMMDHTPRDVDDVFLHAAAGLEGGGTRSSRRKRGERVKRTTSVEEEHADEILAAGEDARRGPQAGSRKRDPREEKGRREGGSQTYSRSPMSSTASNPSRDMSTRDASNASKRKSKGSGARLWRAIVKGLCQVHTAVPGTVQIRHIL